jgi:hypothetical protein
MMKHATLYAEAFSKQPDSMPNKMYQIKQLHSALCTSRLAKTAHTHNESLLKGAIGRHLHPSALTAMWHARNAACWHVHQHVCGGCHTITTDYQLEITVSSKWQAWALLEMAFHVGQPSDTTCGPPCTL